MNDMELIAAFLQVLCYLTVTHAWTCRLPPQQYPAVQIDAGMGSVVMRDRDNQAYILTGSTWNKLGATKLRHVSVGIAGIWGSGKFGKVYKYVAGSFVSSQGLPMVQVDAGGLGQVVGVESRDFTAYCLRSTRSLAFSQPGPLGWSTLSRSLIYYSCGPLYGCWGTDEANRIYVSPRMIPDTCDAGGWFVVDGAAKMVEVGTDGSVFVLNAQGNVFQRHGISSRTPQGTGWTYIPMCSPIKHLSYDLGRLWLVTTSGVILQCTQ